MDLVDEMVVAMWRLRRMRTLETALLDLQMDRQHEEMKKTFTHTDQHTITAIAFDHLANESKSPGLYIRYETTFRRSFDRALHMLTKIRGMQLVAPEPDSSPEPVVAPEPPAESKLPEEAAAPPSPIKPAEYTELRNQPEPTEAPAETTGQTPPSNIFSRVLSVAKALKGMSLKPTETWPAHSAASAL